MVYADMAAKRLLALAAEEHQHAILLAETVRRRDGAATETGRRTGGEAANKPLGIDRAFPWLTARAATPKSADY